MFLALNGFTAATAGAPASPVLNGHAGAFSQSHTATPAIYGTSAFFQLASPSATFPAVRSTLSYSLIICRLRCHHSMTVLRFEDSSGTVASLRLESPGAVTGGVQGRPSPSTAMTQLFPSPSPFLLYLPFPSPLLSLFLFSPFPFLLFEVCPP